MPGGTSALSGGSGIGGNGGNASSLNGTSGSTNTGSGGGGAGHPFASGNNSGTAGNGASGVVILRFPTIYTAPTPTSSNNITTSEVANVAGYRIMTYTCTSATQNGTVTLTF
jgi:hypothetical protein